MELKLRKFVKFVDKFLLVVRASVTQKGALERSLVNMDNMGHSIDGVVFKINNF